MVGLAENDATFKPLKIARAGIKILPSIIYDHPFDFKRILHLIQMKVIEPGMIVSRKMPFDQIESALKLGSEGDETKIVIEMN